MRRLIAFEQLSLDGYFTDANGDMSWAHQAPDDAEWNAFVSGNASGNGMLLFGRVTYQMMERFWPTPAAMQAMPAVAEGMNAMPKVVFSRTLHDVSWRNTTLVHDDPADTVRRMKQEPGPDMAILGSGSLVSQLTQAGLIDELQLVINPVIVGAGRTLFEGVQQKRRLRRTNTRSFANGAVVLYYEPMT